MVADAAVAGSGVGEGADDEGGFVVGVLGGVEVRAAVVVAGALPVAAGVLECFTGGGVAAGLGGEVPAEAEHVCPAPEPAVAAVFPVGGVLMIGAVPQVSVQPPGRRG